MLKVQFTSLKDILKKMHENKLYLLSVMVSNGQNITFPKNVQIF